MPDDVHTTFTSDEIAEQGQGNLTTFILTTLAYLRQHGDTADDWVAFLGRTFAPGWESARDEGAIFAARATALNHVTAGAQLVSVEGDQQHAEGVIIWPDQD